MTKHTRLEWGRLIALSPASALRTRKTKAVRQIQVLELRARARARAVTPCSGVGAQCFQPNIESKLATLAQDWRSDNCANADAATAIKQVLAVVDSDALYSLYLFRPSSS